jgi:hypothetical protein
MNQSTSPAFHSPRRDKQDWIKLRWFEYQKQVQNDWQLPANYQEPVYEHGPATFPCDHEWEVIDDSFSHEYGTEIIVFEQCAKCEQTRDHEPFYYGDEYL